MLPEELPEELPVVAPVLLEDVPPGEELLPEPELPEPELPEAVEPEVVLPAVPAASDLASTFSAVRSMVTGRFGGVPEDELDPLPGLSEAPLPPEEDVPPGDFLSVVISSPPDPCRSQDLHYTHLFAKRYRRSKDFCAAQKNDSPGSG
ncbi:hypothetical protein [Roseibium sp. M-1]